MDDYKKKVNPALFVGLGLRGSYSGDMSTERLKLKPALRNTKSGRAANKFRDQVVLVLVFVYKPDFISYPGASSYLISVSNDIPAVVSRWKKKSTLTCKHLVCRMLTFFERLQWE